MPRPSKLVDEILAPAALARLVERAREGDRAAGDRLVRAFAAEVYGLLYRIVGNHEDAEDLTQETFVRALGSLALYRAEGPFGGWLGRIALHLGRDHQRRRGRGPARVSLQAVDAERQAAPATDRDGPTGGEFGELQRRLSEALQRLPVPLRAALALRVLQGREYDDVAATLGVRPATARTHVMKARRLLQRWLAPWLDTREGGDRR